MCANGYADGARSLSMNFFEQMMILAYFQKHLCDERFTDDVKCYFIDSCHPFSRTNQPCAGIFFQKVEKPAAWQITTQMQAFHFNAFI